MSAEDRNLIVREGRAEWTGTLPRGEGRLRTERAVRLSRERAGGC
jgi:hypothetical protein